MKIGLLGATGRLGSSIIKAALDDGDFEMEPISARSIPARVESRTWIYAALSSALSNCLHRAVFENIRLVIGTTALSEEEFQEMQKASVSIPIFYASNFSLGIALMRKFAEITAKKFHSHAHIDLIEAHHAGKKDAPSGTALSIAKSVEAHHPQPCRLHSLRTGAIPGEHTLRFNTPEEELVISHETHNPIVFGRGALAAARFLQHQPPGRIYGMDDLLEITLLLDNR